MIYKVFNVALELKQTSTNPTFNVIEGDTGNQIKISVTDGGSALDLTGCRVIAIFSKTNGISMQDSGVEDSGIEIGGTYNNEVTVSIFPASLAPGNVECELQIYSGENSEVLVTTARFNFECRRAMMNEDVLLSTNEYPLLVNLIATVETFVDAEAVRVLAEQTREQNEAIRNDNENIRNQNELDRVSAEQNRDDAETARVSNENTRILNEDARKAAETSRVEAEGDRVTAENKRATAETERAAAEQGRATAETARANAETLRANAETERALEFAKWLAANASAVTLGAGSEATVEITEVDGAKHFKFGIPKGADGSGTGDMSKSTYDKNGDGIVDKAADADKLGGKDASEYQGKIALSGILKGNGSTVQVATAGVDYANPAQGVTVTLTAAGWTDNMQTVSVEGATATNIKVVSPAYASVDEYASCGVKAAAEGEGTITFACTTAPENDLSVNVAILG